MIDFRNFFIVAGPCVMEGRAFVFECAHALQEIFSACGVPWIFKSSFDKANRSSLDGFRGMPMDQGL